jgi:predicted exporter
VKQWLESPVSKPFRHLWLGQIGQEQVSLIMLGREHDPEVLAPLFEEMSGVEYVNQVERISDLFTLYREETEGFVALAYGVIFIFLLWKYRIRRALQILTPPALATLLTFAILSLSGQNLNFFNIVSSLLILGIGVDYTIFFAESQHAAEETALAILLSAITTLLSFGLLFLSQTPALASVGLTITLGIGFTMLFSPLACRFGPIQPK